MAETKGKEGVVMQKFVAGLTLSGLALGAVLLSGRAVSAAETRSFTIVNIEYEGTKIWVPGTLVVHKGDTVKLKLINNVKSDPNQHGFAIPALNVEAVVTRGEPKEIEFVAGKAGIFPINCQLHPAHVGGEIVVLE
jgi:FtsP/CotA-like multicopper oxidase with cupredoxin domain